MAEYILRHISVTSIKKTKNQDRCLVWAVPPADIAKQYGVGRGRIFVDTSCVLDTDDEKHKDIVLPFYAYDVSLNLPDGPKTVKILAKDLWQANEDYINSYATTYVTLKHVSKKDIKSVQEDGQVKVIVPFPERVRRECNYNTGYVYLYSSLVKDTDDDCYSRSGLSMNKR